VPARRPTHGRRARSSARRRAGPERRPSPSDWSSGRKIVAATDEATFALVRIGPGRAPEIHSHQEPQMGVIISGTGVHRMILSVRRGRRTVKQVTELLLRPGDCYFIPPGVPHEFQLEGSRPVVALDVTLAKLRHRGGTRA